MGCCLFFHGIAIDVSKLMEVNPEVAMNVKIITLQNVKRVHNL